MEEKYKANWVALMKRCFGKYTWDQWRGMANDPDLCHLLLVSSSQIQAACLYKEHLVGGYKFAEI